MVSAQISSSSEHDGINETQVVLNVYDLTPVNSYTYWFGFGIFHSGIEGGRGIGRTTGMIKFKMTDSEYICWFPTHVSFMKELLIRVSKICWTGGDNDLELVSKEITGLVHGKEYGFGAHDFPVSGVFEVEPRSCPGFIYRASILLGRINMPPSEFRTFIECSASEYHGDTYNLISKNCNHFTDDIAWRLTGKHVPGWVNRLARLGALCGCLLPESLQATTVKQLPEYHDCTEEDGSESLSTATPRESTEMDDNDQEKLLVTSSAGTGEVAFVREATK
ncbi:DUF862 domain-containing protein [Citrus sinensis]|uniref:DUF862 domain-containing protein n=1 Tax=Citrus sinensis TaxID=2711 RepID=A0ACB8NSH6_CITSI|nr:DUF862 domain-containing protein [Citrus sinensis]